MLVEMKRLKDEHLNMVMEWRMLPYITKYMNTDPKLDIEQQRNWYNKIENDDSQIHWVIYFNNKPIGVINLTDIDNKNKHCSWGYYVADKTSRSLELAINLEWNLYDYVFDRLDFNRLYNETFAENKQVVKLHLLCGSKQEGVMRQHIRKNDKYYDVVVSSILKDEWLELRKNKEYCKYLFE